MKWKEANYHIEFKRMVIRMLKELTDYKELSENHNSMKREIETINKNQEEIKNTISEIKHTHTHTHTHERESQAGWMNQRTELESWKKR